MFPVKTFCTEGYHGYNVKFSPFTGTRLACSASKNYGIAGRGLLYVLDQSLPGGVGLITTRSWQDGLFDLAWSETNENVILTASGEGNIEVWDVANLQLQRPVSLLKGHSREVFCIDWSQTRVEQLVISGSLDKQVILWDPARVALLNRYIAHDDVVYSVVWSPHMPGCFASTSGDHTLKIWNIREGAEPGVIVIPHLTEVLSCDWSKYDQNMIATSTVTGVIYCWDLRFPVKPVVELHGHNRAIRRIKFSPHRESLLASVSYDFRTLLWDWKQSSSPIKDIKHHKEFVYGLDFNLHVPGQLADCAWDELIHVFGI